MKDQLLYNSLVSAIEIAILDTNGKIRKKRHDAYTEIGRIDELEKGADVWLYNSDLRLDDDTTDDDLFEKITGHFKNKLKEMIPNVAFEYTGGDKGGFGVKITIKENK